MASAAIFVILLQEAATFSLNIKEKEKKHPPLRFPGVRGMADNPPQDASGLDAAPQGTSDDQAPRLRPRDEEGSLDNGDAEARRPQRQRHGQEQHLAQQAVELTLVPKSAALCGPIEVGTSPVYIGRFEGRLLKTAREEGEQDPVVVVLHDEHISRAHCKVGGGGWVKSWDQGRGGRGVGFCDRRSKIYLAARRRCA